MVGLGFVHLLVSLGISQFLLGHCVTHCVPIGPIQFSVFYITIDFKQKNHHHHCQNLLQKGRIWTHGSKNSEK